MEVYEYKGGLLCNRCGLGIRRELAGLWINRADASTFPQGPIADGGGPGDIPRHCDECATCLGNPLTPEGAAYVRSFVANPDAAGPALAEYKQLYADVLEEVTNEGKEVAGDALIGLA